MNVNFLRNCFIQNSVKYTRLANSLLFQENLNSSHLKLANYCCHPKIHGNSWNGPCNNLNLLFSQRSYSQEKIPNSTNNDANKLPPLMDFPQITWPSLFKTIRNYFIVSFIIKPYFDLEFTLPAFVVGSKKAVEVVSNKLADGDVKTLQGLITSDIVPTLQKTLSIMSLSQRQQIAIDMEDIYFAFPYQIGVIIKEDESKEPKIQKRFVEITMVYHCLKGLASMKSRGDEPPLNMGAIPEYQRKISICNYRFVREFTKGVESDWTVNFLNHFKPVENI